VWRARVKLWLLELVGEELLSDGHDEAAAHVDRHHPWEGCGDEPAERVSAIVQCRGDGRGAGPCHGLATPSPLPDPRGNASLSITSQFLLIRA
jgi:hypothetical protein